MDSPCEVLWPCCSMGIWLQQARWLARRGQAAASFFVYFSLKFAGMRRLYLAQSEGMSAVDPKNDLRDLYSYGCGRHKYFADMPLFTRSSGHWQVVLSRVTCQCALCFPRGCSCRYQHLQFRCPAHARIRNTIHFSSALKSPVYQLGLILLSFVTERRAKAQQGLHSDGHPT